MSDQTTKTEALNLYQKLAAITGEVGAIAKGGTNKEQGYAFIEYAAVAGELRRLFAKYNVVIVPYMRGTQKQTRQEVTSKYGQKGTHALIDFTFVVINADKPDDRFSVTWTGEATDYGDKATNKAATGALKYYLMRQFNISEKGEDPDETTPDQGGNSKAKPTATKAAKPSVGTSEPEMATVTQVNQIRAFARALGIDNDDDIAELLRTDYGVTGKLTKAEAARVLKEMA